MSRKVKNILPKIMELDESPIRHSKKPSPFISPVTSIVCALHKSTLSEDSPKKVQKCILQVFDKKEGEFC